VIALQKNSGHFVVDPGGLILARVVDDRLGERLVLSVADAAARVREGAPVFLAPTARQRFASGPMAFVMVPLRDASGAIIATFGFRIPSQRMAEVLNASRLGATGETYAVDADGRMLTETRNAPEVARLGLLPAEAGGHTTAFLEVRDPGVNLAGGAAAATPQKTWPLTWAAAELAAGRAGVNADGYRDYRGVSVVGAWRWLPRWGLGVVAEVDRDEAYATLALVRRAFRVLAGALLLVAAAIAFSSRRIYGLQKDVDRAQRLGQYTLEEKIGEGGMGAVYRARHAFLRRPTAIKLIRSGLSTQAMLARFEREVQLTSQLTHPNTIAIYDYGRTPEGIFYYAMEYLPGLPLDRVILGDGPQPEARVVHLVKQVCASLAEAHRIGLVHRDIKPANLLLCERGGVYDVVKVLDFGLVKELDRMDDSNLTTAGNIVGTPHFMSPETASGLGNVDARSDVYAVGAVAYQLVTGQNVFAGSSGVEVIGHHLRTAPKPPSERLGRTIDGFLERLILACLAKKPSERPADAGALLQQLEDGWTGPAWTARDARAWWETQGAPMLEARRAAERSLSRGPKLAVDVASRIGTSGSVPELSLDEDEGTKTRIRAPGNPPERRG
jgi:hypothetical protein